MFAVVRMSNVVFGIAISIISFGMGDSDDRISQDLRKYLVQCAQWSIWNAINGASGSGVTDRCFFGNQSSTNDAGDFCAIGDRMQYRPCWIRIYPTDLAESGIIVLHDLPSIKLHLYWH